MVVRFIFVCLTIFIVPANNLLAANGLAVGNNVPRLSLPVDCVPGKNCFIQNYVDIDGGPNMLDYACGKAGYNGHKGVDFRLVTEVDMKRGVSVLAAAPGMVTGMRDGVLDRVLDKNGGGGRIKGKECGNGIVIAHGGGLVTQYCHLRRGSVRVRRGQKVGRGQKIGLVGLSGKTAFPHLHISVRLNKQIIDPFTGHGQDGVCGAGKLNPLWTRRVLEAFPYKSGEVLKTGFAIETVAIDRLRSGYQYGVPKSRDAAAIGFYAWMIKLKAGDIVRISIDGPRGRIVRREDEPLARSRAVHLRFSGRKTPNGGWHPGKYTGRVEVVRDGMVIVQSSKEIIID